MQLVSNKTRSSLDGPFHESFRKFLVNGKRPITSFWSKFLSCALFGYWAIQRRTSGLSLWYLNQLQRSPEVNSQSTSRTNSCSTSTPPAFRLVTVSNRPFSSESRVFVACCLFFLLNRVTCWTIRRKHTRKEHRTFH